MIAPMVAPMMVGKMPEPRWMPKRGKSQLPMKSTHNADCDVGDQPKACALYRLASEPTRNKANHQDDK